MVKGSFKKTTLDVAHYLIEFERMNGTKTFFSAAIFLSSSLLIGCGGGGGGAPESYAGFWTGNLFLARNTCPFDVPDAVRQNYAVNQAGTRVVVDAGYATLEGVLEGNSGFIVGQEAVRDVRPDGTICVINSAVRFVGEDSKESEVTRQDRLDCQGRDGRANCEVIFVGQLSREDD